MPLLESCIKRFYKLSYIGNFSIQTKKKLNNIVLKCCKATTTQNLCFHQLKLLHYFQWKTRYHLIWDFALFINLFVVAVKLITLVGRTKWHLSTRIKEHLETDKKSQVHKHLNESQRCQTLRDNDCFCIIDYKTTLYSLSIKKDMHIFWQKPALKKHVDFLSCSICV